MPLSLRLAAIALAATLGAMPAKAGEAPLVVLELFTSQGCSSCPPADALVAELAGREGVLPLALHVDYWDYIGWADSFARPEHTERQKAYARMAHSGSIYTPQIVIGGVDHVVGFKPMAVADHLAAHEAAPAPVALVAEQTEDGLRITCAPAAKPLPGPVHVDLVRFVPQATIEIKRGENAGETITYANIVTGWDRLGTWDGQGTFEVIAAAAGDEPLAVIVQAPGPGRVLSAFRIR